MSSNITLFLSSPISAVIPLPRPREGDIFGVEFEFEGKNLRTNEPIKNWAPHEDGSLRNHHGDAIEYVLAKPVNFDNTVRDICNLFLALRKNKAKIVASNRTSTHVHFNMSNKKVYQVFNTFFVFTILEDILTDFCGEDRVGNLFALSTRHAEALLRLVDNSLKKYQNFRDFQNEVRYAAFNFCSLNKFGTIEFRSMGGMQEGGEGKAIAWLTILNEMLRYSLAMKNPVDLIRDFSLKTPYGLLKDIFSEGTLRTLLGDRWDRLLIDQSMFQGMRLIQGLCYTVGEVFDEVENILRNEQDPPKGKVRLQDEFQNRLAIPPQIQPQFINLRPQPDDLWEPQAAVNQVMVAPFRLAEPEGEF